MKEQKKVKVLDILHIMVRLVTFRAVAEAASVSTTRVGALLQSGHVLDLSKYSHSSGIGGSPGQLPLPYSSTLGSMLKVIEQSTTIIPWIREAVNRVESAGTSPAEGCVLTAEDVFLAPPIPLPQRNLFCVGKNYLDHVAETAKTLPNTESAAKYPQFFGKASTTVVRPFGDIESHPNLTKVP